MTERLAEDQKRPGSSCSTRAQEKQFDFSFDFHFVASSDDGDDRNPDAAPSEVNYPK